MANQQIVIRYGLDTSSPDTTLTTITSATTPSSGVKGRHFIQVSDGTTTKKFFNLTYDIQLGNTNQAVTFPVVYAVTAEAWPLENRETWEMVLRLKDEKSGVGRTRRSNTQDRADVQRDNLRTLFSNRAAFTLLDAYRYPEEIINSSSHVVFIEELRDVVQRSGEGAMYVRLVAVPT